VLADSFRQRGGIGNEQRGGILAMLSLNKQVEKALEEYLETKESLGYIFIPDLEEAERAIDEGEVEPVWKGE